jgi:hypothetical protein
VGMIRSPRRMRGQHFPGKHIVNNNLTPEEDAIGDPDEDNDDIDDTLPADLWFRGKFDFLPASGFVRSKWPSVRTVGTH